MSAQWQLSVGSLLTAGDILDRRVWEEASKSGPLRATLPTEVVTVSIYVTPIASSLMMQLILMVEIPGVATSPMGMVPRGASRATSTSSGVCRQAVTPAKPHSGVGGCTSANAFTGKEALGGVRVFGGEARGFTHTVWGS